MACICEFANVGHHENACSLKIPLIKRLEAAKARAIAAYDFEGAAAIRDAIIVIRTARASTPPEVTA